MMIQINMDVPKTCGECRFADYTSREYPFCTVLQQDRGYPFDVNKKKFPNCPIHAVEEQKDDSKEAKLKNICRVMFNRCKAVGSAQGAMCIWCGLKEECEEMSST